MSSADPGRLLPPTHVKNAVATDSAFERHCSGRFLRDYTDAGGLLGNWQPEQDIESRIGVFQRHNCESTLVGHIRTGQGRGSRRRRAATWRAPSRYQERCSVRAGAKSPRSSGQVRYFVSVATRKGYRRALSNTEVR